jgi:lincosamide nucleotidyltransferase A/C/D/E
MISRDVLALYEQTNGAGITIWIDGGWGVDALVGKQSRAHEDFDIVIERKDVPAFRVLLERQAYTETRVEYARPWNFVLGDVQGREVDVHVIVFDGQGNGLYGPVEQGMMYPAASLTGTGTIDRHVVRCISAEWMVKFHSGYALTEKISVTSPLCAKSSELHCRTSMLSFGSLANKVAGSLTNEPWRYGSSSFPVRWDRGKQR